MAKAKPTLGELDAAQLAVITLQAKLVGQTGFFLAGGTGLALRLRHRFSNDLDWFTPDAFDAKKLIARLRELPQAPTQITQSGPHTVRAYYEKVETSFIRYDQVPAKPETLKVGGATILVADFALQAAMKAAALHDRGARRDFIDIHAIASSPRWSLARFIENGARHLPLAPEQITRALLYFVDADREPMPRGCAVPWDQVKHDLEEGVRAWERERKLTRRELAAPEERPPLRAGISPSSGRSRQR